MLPTNATAFEKRLADVCDFHRDVSASISGISHAKLTTRPPGFLPWLIEEYGLGELTPYIANPYDLIDTGPKWQQVRGSLAAVDLGLSWIKMSARFTAAWTGRVWWNSFQLHFNQLPGRSRLKTIEAITDLSKSLRSDFRRGVYGYDVEAVESDMSRLDHSMLESESGVRVTDGSTLFSFGRRTEINHILTKKEGTLIGNWIDDIDDELNWEDINYPWELVNFPWCSVKKHERDMLMALWFQNRTLYFALTDAKNALIGYRRCNIIQAVEQTLDGVYSHSGKRFNPSMTASTMVLLGARTEFHDVDSQQAAFVSLLVHASVAKNVPPGKLWLKPDELIGGVEIIKTPVNIPLRADIREQFKILLRF